MNYHSTMRSDLVAHIDPARVAHNVGALRSACRPGTKLCAAIKANAYGHGVRIIAPALERLGVEMAAVATIPEAIELREIGWARPILVLGSVLAIGDAAERSARVDAILEHDLTTTISSAAGLDDLTAAAAKRRTLAHVHLKTDTGLGRQGAMPDDLPELVAQIVRAPSLRLTGIYSHFANADLADRAMTQKQLDEFHRQLTQLSDFLPAGVTRHLANSAAALTLPESHFEMIRPGLAIYGYLPAESLAGRVDLRPILRLTAHITLTKRIPTGHGVGYGHTWKAQRPSRIGILPIGYADGFVRRLSNNAVVGTQHGDAPIIGRVSMDQTAIDLTELPAVAIGDEVVLIDDRRERPNSVESLARSLGTISYEVTCLLGQRIDRIVRNDNA